MKKIKIRLLAALLCALLLAAPSYADLLFTRQDQAYSNTALGIFHGADGPVSPLVSNMGGNSGQGIYAFRNAEGAFRVAITLYTGNGTDVISIYDPGDQSSWSGTTAWERPIREAATTLHNTRMLVELDGNLYATAYDIPIICRITTAGDVYKQDTKYEYYSADSKYNGHGEALVAYNGNLYGIFTGGVNEMSATKGEYRPNELVKLDKDLNQIELVQMEGKNIDGFTPGAYAVSGSELYVTSLGGTQPFNGQWNTGSRIELVNLDTMEVSTLVTAEDINRIDPTFGHMIGAIAFAGDKIYIQAFKWTASEGAAGGFDIRIYETTAADLKNGDIGTLVKEFSGDYGYRVGLVYDEATKYLWAGVGYSIWRFDGTEWTEFDMNALKGIISAFTAVDNGGSLDPSTPSGDSGGGGGSGGCSSAAFPAVILVAALPSFCLVTRRQKFSKNAGSKVR